MPNVVMFSQTFVSPFRQYSQRPQVMFGSITTLSPGLTLLAIADVGNRRYVLVPKNASGSCRMARRIGEDVDIGATDADAINPQQDIVCRRDLWPREILQSPVARSMKNYRLHCFAHRLRLR